MAHHMLDAEKSRIDMMRSRGVDGYIVPQHEVLEGVNTVRRMLSRTLIDPYRCARGLEALRQYRREWDDKLKDWRPNEHKDWTNHGADALRTFAAGFDDPTSVRPMNRRRGDERSTRGTHWSA
jgi:phage terminase large subunit